MGPINFIYTILIFNIHPYKYKIYLFGKNKTNCNLFGKKNTEGAGEGSMGVTRVEGMTMLLGDPTKLDLSLIQQLQLLD